VPDSALLARADEVSRRVVKASVEDGRPLLRVRAPPGAGKTRLTRQVMQAAIDANLPTLVVVQTNAQAIDLVRGMATLLATAGHRGRFGYWPSQEACQEYASEIDPLRTHPNVVVCRSTAEARSGPDVLVAVARKWAWHACARIPDQLLERDFDLGVIDEAYQMQTGELLRFGARADRLLMIGDPGQLEPFTTIETARWTGLEASAVAPAPRSVEARRGHEIQGFDLPASLRLDTRAVRVVQACFYPNLSFDAVALDGDRTLTLSRSGAGRRGPADRDIDAVLDRAASTGWGLLELPRAVTVRDDPEVAAAIAAVVHRLLEREPRVRRDYPAELRHGAPLRPDQIAVGTAHRDQRARVREAIDALGPQYQAVVVDTANRIQGREFDVTIVWHPLTGRVDATAFHLDTGRLCVLASRHRHACILVTRHGLRDLLEEHLPSGLRPRRATEDREHDGWEAHRRMLEMLAVHSIP